MKKHAIVFTALSLLAACASSPTETLEPVQQGHEITLLSEVHFQPVLVPGSDPRHRFHGLAPGAYKVVAKDERGDFYLGDGAPLIFDAHLTEANERVDSRVAGGFWLSRDVLAAQPVRLFRLAASGARRDDINALMQPPTCVRTEVLGLGVALGGAIGAAVGSSARTCSPTGIWTWQFVPIVSGSDDLEKISVATRLRGAP